MPGFVWMFGGLVIGLFIAFLVYLDKQPPSEISFSDAVKTELDKIKQHNATRPAESKPEIPARQEPKFNFYTILPELEVLIPEDEIRPAGYSACCLAYCQWRSWFFCSPAAGFRLPV